ncbi:hypothetical protein [Methylotuvimicrobium buryatense]|uniref:hypothetical protein n=1 Tax=Methylotuvimicrobium buryatense TaxID=95641 RepID=UPI000345A196|nr:hypothetical protein [Methylotuvimicrobium buryatense]
MKKHLFKSTLLIILLSAATLVPATTYAQKPDWQDSGKPQKSKDNFKKGDKRQHDQPRGGGDKRQSGTERHSAGSSRQDRGADIRQGDYFGDRQRIIIRDYYSEQFRRGHCPPGLAKKNNGCLPPGQAKKWQVGRPLPRNVVFHDLPPAVALELGPPPTGHRFVRVASDILMVTTGTGMVIDAIQDLGGF